MLEHVVIPFGTPSVAVILSLLYVKIIICFTLDSEQENYFGREVCDFRMLSCLYTCEHVHEQFIKFIFPWTSHKLEQMTNQLWTIFHP